MLLTDTLDLDAPFALFEKNGVVTACQGPLHQLEKLMDIHTLSKAANADVAFILPYRAIRERGFEARGEEPVLALEMQTVLTLPVEKMLILLPEVPVEVRGEVSPSLSDEAYAALVTRLQVSEIEGGNASQIVLSRRFEGQIAGLDVATVLAVYRRLLQRKGQYMTVLFATGSQFIIGATPERHIEIRGNETIMIPIAGTLRKEDRATFEDRLHAFISDAKEINELFQVMDEEMKMMSLVCPSGGAIHGPLLREIGAVIHTEYELVGNRGTDSIAALRHVLHAPTVLGSPMESAARIIRKYEPDSRRYYSGEVGIYRQPRTAEPNGDLDTAILIRCAEIFADGRFVVQAGGGIVRDSDPANEARESRAKAMGILGVITGATADHGVYLTPELRAEIAGKLESRNRHVAEFWMARQDGKAMARYNCNGLRLTILNNEDDFAFMIGHLLRHMGAVVEVVDSLAYDPAAETADLVILGPGPGDPTDMTHPRMKKLQETIAALRATGKPLLGICLGHQALAFSLGLPVTRQPRSTQGLQREVKVFGEVHRLGFYNSFSPVLPGEGRG
jgi:phenazine biosynthesis protein phzE